jgi:hypothetical protein
MLTQSPKPARNLIHAIVSTKSSNHYAFFLGAGCSVSSGVRSASSLIREWRAHRFLLEVEWRPSDSHTENDYRRLAEYCSNCLDKGGIKKEAGEYRYLTIEPEQQHDSLKGEILSVIGEQGFVDKRHWGSSSALSDTVPFYSVNASVFSSDEFLPFDDKFHDWLKRQTWFEDPAEYSVLFESLYPLPSQRQAFIEEEVEYARPYWGYLYLANTMSTGFFDICFTTNFDDLLNDAFSTFVAERKPIVCSHDAMVSQIRLTSKRPKILKLHGDFLYDSIKNTQKELRSLEGNMEAKLSQFAKEIGLIVVGYSGNDASVMTILAHLLRDPDCFPYGIHWCVLKGSQIGSKVVELLQYERVLLYEIENFDSLMADFYQELNMPEPKLVTNPVLLLGHEIDRCGSAVFSEDPHPLIDKHIRQLANTVVRLLPPKGK